MGKITRTAGRVLGAGVLVLAGAGVLVLAGAGVLMLAGAGIANARPVSNGACQKLTTTETNLNLDLSRC